MDDKKIDLSIIIPVYNTPHKLLERCFASVSSIQGWKYEVILIDDGSQTETGEICRKYAEQHPAFSYRRKKNEGVSLARNKGIEYASGRYITFIDSDDLLIGNVLDSKLLEKDYDLIIFDLFLVEGNLRTIWSSFDGHTRLLSHSEFLTALVTTRRVNSPCAKLYKRSILAEHQIQFNPSYITGEDKLFIFDYFSRCNTIYYTQTPLYCYYKDGHTDTQRLNRFPDQALDNKIGIFHKKLEFIQDKQFNLKDSDHVLMIAVRSFINNIFNTACSLALLGKLNKKRRKKIYLAVAKADSLCIRVDTLEAQMKRFIIVHRLWGLIMILAPLRAFYLKTKNKYRK